jgi:hypothetical protein
MKHRNLLGMLIVAIVVTLAACGDESPTPTDATPLLVGFDAMPKQLATVMLTPTPSPVMVGGESVAVAQPTPTAGRSGPTPTLTPYVGIFLGEPTLESGEIAPTLAPWVINPGSSGPVMNTGGISPAGGSLCNQPVATTLATAYNGHPEVQQNLGCPVNGGTSALMVSQPFEHGTMYWRDTRQIYALANSGQFWQVADGWNEGMPADDPALVPPADRLQPVRGFGLAWRTSQAIRDTLGWGLQPETPYNAFWQDFERGALFLGMNNQAFALYTAESRHSGPLAP